MERERFEKAKSLYQEEDEILKSLVYVRRASELRDGNIEFKFEIGDFYKVNIPDAITDKMINALSKYLQERLDEITKQIKRL